MKNTITMIFVYVITRFISIFCVQVHSMIFFAEFHVAPPSYGGLLENYSEKFQPTSY